MFAFILNPLTLWISGAVVAAGVTGYVVVENYLEPEKKPEIVAEEKAPEAEKPTEIASLPEEKPKAAPKLIEYPLPKFDLLRVEKDGSAVIAGSAPAGSTVEIFDADTTIATEGSGESGQFVVVLDKPLSPGSHELVIRATLLDGRVLVSAEAGIINVPDGGNDLVAMVVEPGKASKIMQAPEPEPTPVAEPKKEVEIASIEPQPGEKPAPVVEAPKPVEKTEEPKAVVKAVEEPIEKIETPKPEEKPIVKVEEPKPVEKAEEPKPVEKIEEVKAEEPKPVVKPEEPKPVEKIEEAKPVETVKVETKPEEPVKSVTPVLIQAADVEGNKLFIAGTGQPGAMVHIYINGEFLGDTAIGDEGSYLFEGNNGLEAGRHAVRADMTDKGSATVLARAVVSLLHEPVIVKPVVVAKIEPKVEVQKKVEAPKVEAPKPVVKKLAPVESVKKVEPPKVIEKKPVEVAMKKEEAKAPEPSKVVEQPAKPVEQKIVKKVEEPAPEPMVENVQEPVVKPMVEPKVEMAAVTQEAPKEIVTGSSVIIRKGDNLWLVSRRKYGEGIRYTTIFEANKAQIRDPNLIFPGQVFDIPDSEKTN